MVPKNGRKWTICKNYQSRSARVSAPVLPKFLERRLTTIWNSTAFQMVPKPRTLWPKTVKLEVDFCRVQKMNGPENGSFSKIASRVALEYPQPFCQHLPKFLERRSTTIWNSTAFKMVPKPRTLLPKRGNWKYWMAVFKKWNPFDPTVKKRPNWAHRNMHVEF